MHLVFPMNNGTRFKDSYFSFPKPLIEMRNSTMFERAFNLYKKIDDLNVTILINKQDDNEYHLRDVLEQITSGTRTDIVTTNGVTSGSLCTTLLAYDKLIKDDELIVANYDQELSINLIQILDDFRKRSLDFAGISFDAAHPMWSYVKLDNSGYIVQASEKKPISRQALAGFYYFKSSSTFLKCAEKVLISSPVSKKVFYISEIFNQLILENMNGGVTHIEKELYTKFYDAAELSEFLNRSHKDVEVK